MNKIIQNASTLVILFTITLGTIICSQTSTEKAIACSSIGNYSCHNKITLKSARLFGALSNFTTRKIKLILKRCRNLIKTTNKVSYLISFLLERKTFDCIY